MNGRASMTSFGLSRALSKNAAIPDLWGIEPVSIPWQDFQKLRLHKNFVRSEKSKCGPLKDNPRLLEISEAKKYILFVHVAERNFVKNDHFRRYSNVLKIEGQLLEATALRSLQKKGLKITRFFLLISAIWLKLLKQFSRFWMYQNL